MVEGVETLKTAFKGIDKMLEEAQPQKHREDLSLFCSCFPVKPSSDIFTTHGKAHLSTCLKLQRKKKTTFNLSAISRQDL